MFREMPRYIGFPNQFWCESEFAFNNFEKMFKNKAPFFVSTFKFKDKETPIIDNLYFDIDSYFSIRVPYRNIKRLKSYCEKMDIPTVINFSGGKGFHLYALIKPMIPTSPKTKETVRDLMYSVQMRMAKESKIEAFDEPTFARLRFLTRFPTSKYIRKDTEVDEFDKREFYCRYLTDEEFDSGLKRIIKVIQEPGELPNTPKPTQTLQEIADSFDNFKVLHRENGITERIIINRKGDITPTIKALGLPCLQELSSHSHPSHFERVELVAWLKHLGYSDISINAFIKNCNWTRYSYPKTSYQVRTINPRMVKCSFLRKSYGHLCEKCPLKKMK